MLTAHIIVAMLCEPPSLIPVFRRALEMHGEQTITTLLEVTLQIYVNGNELKNDGSNQPRTWGGSLLKLLKMSEHAHYIFKGY